MLADLHSVLLEKFSQIANRRITPDMITRWDIADSFKPGLTSSYSNAWDDYEPDRIAPYESDAGFSIALIRKTAPVDIVTAHSEPSRKSIERWLSLNHIPYDGLVLVGKGNGVHKLTVAGAYDVFIDDNPNLAARAPSNIFIFLYSQPWNQLVSELQANRNIIRIRSLREVSELLHRLQTKFGTSPK